MPRTLHLALLALVCLGLYGCATLPPGEKPDPRDPWERLNRSTYKFNHAVDKAVARPVATAYSKYTPRPVRTGVSNFMDNLFYPVTMANDLLQLKFKPFVQDVGRFVVNSTIGLGGLFDPASHAGIPKNDEDLGQTFGYWGAPPGPYFVIPILGPSDVRDGIGRIGDAYLTPLQYVNSSYLRYGVYGLYIIDTRYRLLPQDKTLDEAYDPYTLLKNAYLQRREYLVRDGKLSEKQREQQEQQQYDEEQRIIEQTEGAGEPKQEPQPPPK